MKRSRFTEEQIIEFVRCKQDPVYFAEHYIKIVNVDRGLIPFEMYEFQKKLIKNLEFDEIERPIVAQISCSRGVRSVARAAPPRTVITAHYHGDRQHILEYHNAGRAERRSHDVEHQAGTPLVMHCRVDGWCVGKPIFERHLAKRNKLPGQRHLME